MYLGLTDIARICLVGAIGVMVCTMFGYVAGWFIAAVFLGAEGAGRCTGAGPRSRRRTVSSGEIGRWESFLRV